MGVPPGWLVASPPPRETFGRGVHTAGLHSRRKSRLRLLPFARCSSRYRQTGQFFAIRAGRREVPTYCDLGTSWPASACVARAPVFTLVQAVSCPERASDPLLRDPYRAPVWAAEGSG